jgi:uncharacterized membrane protein YedE/YeeE
MPLLAILASGILFGAGLALSGMVNPMKVVNFLDLTGLWDPSLIFVMAGGLIVTVIGYRLAWSRQRPLFAQRFALPSASAIDTPLIAGAALFGLGWGLAGFCPGPAIASLVFGRAETLIFIIAMAAGMLIVRVLPRTAKTKELAP